MSSSMTDNVENHDLKEETLAGDIRDAMLMTIRDMKRPWSLLIEDEQREINARMEMAAKHLVRQTVQLLTDYEFPRAAVSLGEVKIKGEKGIEAKIECPNIEHNRNVLGDHVGSMVMMLMVDSETFMGESEPADVVPDQQSILPDA